MNEFYLHHLWRNKQILPINLKLIDGRICNVINYGFYNKSMAGPDFSMGIIEIEGIEEVGPIEMHIKSSDWIKHGHQNDARYNNVVLHVVYEHDIDIIQNNRLLPTLELRPLIAKGHFNTGSGSWDLPCQHSLNHIPKSVLNQTLRDCYKFKLENRLNRIEASDYKRGVLYKLLAYSFGGQLNGESFLEFANSMPVESFIGMNKKQIKQLILEKSGLRCPDSSNKFNWQFKGSRPSSFPTIRIEQFSALISELIFDDDFLSAAIRFDVHSIKKHIQSVNCQKPLSKSFIDGLILNTFAPFAFAIMNQSDIDKIIPVLRRMKSERNQITMEWEQIGMSIRNAFESQSLISLYKYFCTYKKCLSCGIGKSILSEL